ncbi:MDR family MFS transporter [Actinacidiphila glaucinigra]|uniref:MDR family MFS transporter n=1 Tax=Actinacidiphila glaucinigra TaxID=235986 RepID=UPI0036C321F4
MRGLRRQVRSFDTPARLLMANQFAINLGFYMLMPYLADHLAGGLGLAAWAVGLVLGVRNFSQQGMFVLGGTIADRFGYKTPIVIGCTLRTVGFALLGLVDSLPALVAASAAAGFAGALFNPAVRAYLAVQAGERRVEGFALFNVFYQAGVLIGPLVGLALLALDFRAVCLTAAAVFAVLTVLQCRALPDRRPGHAGDSGAAAGVLGSWRQVLGNRPFMLFSLAMIGSYVLSFQVYLALPLQAHKLLGSGGQAVTSGLFIVSAVVAVLGQLRITGWVRARWSGPQAIVGGILLMGLAFTPLAVSPDPSGGTPSAVIAVALLVTAVALLAVGSAVVYPFEMDTIVTLSGERLVATHYGWYNTVSGVGITVGNLATGAVWGIADDSHKPWLPWLALTATGLLCAVCVQLLSRAGGLAAVTREPALA